MATKRITMLQTRTAPGGSLMTAAGSPYTVAKQLADEMVGAGYALDTDLVDKPPKVGGPQPVLFDPQSQSLVSAEGNAFGKVFIAVDPDLTATLDQTTVVQRTLDSCLPGQTAVLPPAFSFGKFVKCGAIRIPSGVSLSSDGAILVGATITFSPSQSQAFNSRIKEIWLKQCKFVILDVSETGTASSATSNTLTDSSKAWDTNEWAGWYVKITSGTGTANISRPILSNTGTQLQLSGTWSITPDATSVYQIFCNINSVVFDGAQIDGTGIDNTGSTSGNAVTIGQFGFDTKFIGGTQIWNYSGWGIAIYGNTDTAANTGTAYLAAGVFTCLSDVKIFNCGGAGSGGGLLAMGGPRDGGSLHLTNVLIDHCQYGILTDDSQSGDPTVAASGSGGLTVIAANLRVELCGKVGAGPETPAILNVRANWTVMGLWNSSAITTSLYKNIHHRFGSFVAIGGRVVTDSATVYGIYCDTNVMATWEVAQNNNYNIGARRLVVANDSLAVELEYLRFRIAKGTTGVTVACSSGSGFGWGAGGGAGDRWSNATSSEITAGGASANVGSAYTQVYYQASAGGGIYQVTLAFKAIGKVLGAHIQKQTANIAGLTADVQLLNGTANFSIIFTDATGAEKNIISSMTTGQYIDVAVGIGILR